jgi:TRAP-type C4-dicarboxylate transport system substrate-binding protein
MTAIDAAAPTALWVKVFIDFYIPAVDQKLAKTGNYQIKWNKAFGGTIAKPKGVFEALEYDLADIGIITTPYHPDKVPFYNLPYVTPFVTTDIELVSRTMNELMKRYPQTSEVWEEHDQIALTAAGSIDTYQVFMDGQLKDLNGFKGKRIGSVGLALRYLEGVGATGVTSDLVDWYNSISTGLLNGVVSWTEASVAYKLYEVAPYFYDVRIGAITSKVLSVNKKTWDRLPEEVQVALREAAEDYRIVLSQTADQLSQSSRKEFVDQGGEIITLTQAERQSWAENIPNLAKNWVADMEQRGLPGRQMLIDYMDIMRANNQPIVRHWDREL